jgi:hypothetical protein
VASNANAASNAVSHAAAHADVSHAAHTAHADMSPSTAAHAMWGSAY